MKRNKQLCYGLEELIIVWRLVELQFIISHLSKIGLDSLEPGVKVLRLKEGNLGFDIVLMLFGLLV